MTAAARVFEYNARVYRRNWRGTLFVTFVGPMLFLASMGFGLGRFVDQGQNAAGALGGVTYAMFLAPALLAAQAMQTAGFESTYPIMGRIVWDKIYHGMLATPITVSGIVLGQLAWIAVRLFIVTGAFFLVMTAFGIVRSPLGVLAVPVAVLTGLAFSAPIVAFTATQRNDQGFNAIFRFGITPLFLFSGTFFPIDQLPGIRPAHRVRDAPVARRRAGTWAVAGQRRACRRRRPSRGAVRVHHRRHARGAGDVPANAGHVAMTELATRIAPPWAFGSRAGRLIERNVMVYRRTWLVLVSGFFEPLFYLLGIGFGLGTLIGNVPGPDGQSLPYGVFVAPGLLATSAMNGAIYDSTFNVFFKLRYAKTYDAILSTPMSIGDVALGEVTWALIRGSLYATGFLVVVAVLGLARSPLVLLALPGAVLIGFAFAAVGMAATTFMRSWRDFDLIFVVTLPLFLFSATFYPITAYPPALQFVVQLTPLYHGVDLLRSVAIGDLGPVLLVHVAYLLAMGVAGLAVVARRLDRLLLK